MSTVDPTAHHFRGIGTAEAPSVTLPKKPETAKPPRGPRRGRRIGAVVVGAVLTAGAALGLTARGSGNTEVEAGARPTTTSATVGNTSPSSTAPNTAPAQADVVMMPPLTVEGVTIERLDKSTDFLALFTSSDNPEDIMRSYERIREYTFNYGKTLDDHLGSGGETDKTLWTVPLKILHTDYLNQFSPEVRAEWEDIIDETTSLREGRYDPDIYRDTVVDSIDSVTRISETEMEITVHDYEQVAYLGSLEPGPVGEVTFHWVKQTPPEVFGYAVNEPVWRVATSHSS